MTRDEAKKRASKIIAIGDVGKSRVYPIIDKLCDTHEAEKQEILNILKKLDEFPPIEKDKAINELIYILEEMK